MNVSQGSASDIEQEDENINTNTLNATTTSLELEGASVVGLYVTDTTGSHGSHIVTLQVSADDTAWFDTAHTVTGLGNMHDVTCVAKYVRGKVTTAEGSASTVKIIVLAK